MISRNRTLSVAFTVSAALARTLVSAEEPTWQEVTSNPEVVVEVDAANIRVREHMLTAWVRVTTAHDSGIEGKRFRSAISLTVFDCDAEKSGTSTTTTFAGPRGEGKLVQKEEGLPVGLARLSYERPGTGGYRVLKFVCGRAMQSGTANADSIELPTVNPEQSPSENEAETVRSVRMAGMPAQVTRPVDPDDYYPPGSIRREERGSPVVKICVGPSGNLLREPLVTDTSGFPELDAAAIKVAKATRYAAGTENGSALAESCLKFTVKFDLKTH